MSRAYRNKSEYIDSLREVMSAREDFKDLTYHKSPTSQEEFLFLSDIVGRVFYFDITGMRNEDIYRSMAQVECGIKPECFVSDNARMMEIGKMFN